MSTYGPESQDFTDSLEKGNLGERIVAAHFSRSVKVGALKSYKKISHLEFPNRAVSGEHDFQLERPNGSFKAAEVKTLEGSEVRIVNGEELTCRYRTGVIEVWQDDKKTNRPGWWKSTEAGELDAIYFVNLFDRTVYVFNSKKLLSFLQRTLPPLTICNDGNNNAPGWIALIGWTDKQAGFLYSF
jgi:hypothetical protein